MVVLAQIVFFISVLIGFLAATSKLMAFLDTNDTSLQNIAMALSSVGLAWGLIVMVIYGYILQ